jgi:hypothetical protein
MNDLGNYLIEKGFIQIENQELSEIFNTKDIKIYQARELYIVILKGRIAICTPSSRRILNEPTWAVSVSNDKYEVSNIIKQFLCTLGKSHIVAE